MSIPQVFLAVAVGASAVVAAVSFGAFAVGTEGRGPAWWIHQVWFNFFGALVGWAALWILGVRLTPGLFAGPIDVSLADGGLALLAFVGITGYLPATTATLLASIVEVAKALLNLLPKGSKSP